jgi:hypothetical protein
MILYKPYRASDRMIALIVKGTIAKLYIYDSAWSKNFNLNDGLLSDLISFCSLSVGIMLYIWASIDWKAIRVYGVRKVEYKGGAF